MTPFRSAADARSLGLPLTRLFVTALGRVPDPSGLATLVQARRNGTDLATVAGDIVRQSEFLSRHGPDGPPDAHYLRALCWASDGRDPGPADEALLQPGATRAGILLAVSQSWRGEAISLADSLFPGGLPPDDDVAYQLWLDTVAEPPERRAARARQLPALPRTVVSVLALAPATRPDLLAETVRSLSCQDWPHWECLLVVGAGLPPHAQAAARKLAASDPAITVVEAETGDTPAAQANRALARATGSLTAWLEPGDQLAPDALQVVVAATLAGPPPHLVYTDEDRIAGDGARTAPWLKQGWSADLALAGDTIGQLALFNRVQALSADGFDAADAPFERYGLALRVADAAPPGGVRHVAGLLFHRGRQTGRPERFPQARAISAQPALAGVVQRFLRDRRPGLALAERRFGAAPWPALAAALPDPAPRVSVIIPMRDHASLLEQCLHGLLRETDYPDIEVVVVDNGSVETESLRLLARIGHDPRIRVIQRPGPFNWSALNNDGAAEATGSVLLLLNNDIEVTEPDWLRVMVANAVRPDVGAVGARLLFGDGHLQHGGVLLGPKGQAVHAMTWADATEPGYAGQVALQRDLSAVTGACLAIRRDVFDAVGGLEQDHLRVAWGDIDLCLRVRQAGLRVLWLPGATLLHHEMATRGRDTSPDQQARHEAERGYLRRRWPGEVDRDPFLNPLLDATATGLVLSREPRIAEPPAPDNAA